MFIPIENYYILLHNAFSLTLSLFPLQLRLWDMLSIRSIKNVQRCKGNNSVYFFSLSEKSCFSLSLILCCAINISAARLRDMGTCNRGGAAHITHHYFTRKIESFFTLFRWNQTREINAKKESWCRQLAQKYVFYLSFWSMGTRLVLNDQGF